MNKFCFSEEGDNLKMNFSPFMAECLLFKSLCCNCMRSEITLQNLSHVKLLPRVFYIYIDDISGCILKLQRSTQETPCMLGDQLITLSTLFKG